MAKLYGACLPTHSDASGAICKISATVDNNECINGTLRLKAANFDREAIDREAVVFLTQR